MKEYIEREAALKAMSQAIQDRTWSMEDCDVMMQMEDYVADLSAADVAPVVHGTWSLESDEEMPNLMFKLVICSACGEKANHTYNYCPNCGAKMDGGDE